MSRNLPNRALNRIENRLLQARNRARAAAAELPCAGLERAGTGNGPILVDSLRRAVGEVEDQAGIGLEAIRLLRSELQGRPENEES